MSGWTGVEKSLVSYEGEFTCSPQECFGNHHYFFGRPHHRRTDVLFLLTSNIMMSPWTYLRVLGSAMRFFTP